jgi:uncharacterized protein YegP (UPF0339 family)
MREGPAFYVYRDQAQEYRWSLKSPNARTIADSADGYSTKSGCMDAVDRIETAIRYRRPHIHDQT